MVELTPSKTSRSSHLAVVESRHELLAFGMACWTSNGAMDAGAVLEASSETIDYGFPMHDLH